MTTSQESSSTMIVPLAPETILQQRYRIVRQLGRGGMGAVYEAVDQRLGITVALKETASTDAAVRRQFEQEARLLAAMSHPALPLVSDHFTEGDRAFLVMEFIGGVDLARIIAQQPGPFPRDRVIAWADQLLDALIYLHTRERQVIHRDIKPHNLKLTAGGQLALLDFGLAKTQSSDTSNTSSSSFFGYTRQYAPLEQIQDRPTDTRSDIYALGATLYHLITGVKPPDALLRAAAVVNGEPDPLRPAHQVTAAVGPEIGCILAKAMAQKAEDRFTSASDFREALRRVGGRAKAGEDTSSESESCSEARREKKTIKLDMVVSDPSFGPGTLTALIVAVLLLGVVLLFGSQNWSAVSSVTGTSHDAFSIRPKAVASQRVNIRNSNHEKSNSIERGTGRAKSVTASARREPSPHGKRAQTPLVSAPPVRLPTLELSEMSNLN